MNRLNSEDYIRAAYYLENEEGEAKPGRIAQRLGVSKNTVSAMVGKLARKKLLVHESYGRVRLGKAGMELGRKLTYRHRLIESFLYEILKVPKGKIHGEACRLEHDFGEESIIGIRKILKNPKMCPHGKDINA